MKYSQAYVSLTQVINQMLAETMDENTVTSLRSMLELSAFQPIRDVIETKIIDVGNFLKEKEEKKSLLDMMTQVRAESLKESHNVDDAVIVEEEEEDLDSPPFEYEIVMKDYFKTPRMDHPQAPWSKKDPI
jgi:capsular polysaccharide biosynthesis protein